VFQERSVTGTGDGSDEMLGYPDIRELAGQLATTEDGFRTWFLQKLEEIKKPVSR
jgi:hypothetical protein